MTVPPPGTRGPLPGPDVTIRLIEPGRLSADLTGAFPKTSSRGNKYVLVVHAHGPNAIIPFSLKNRKSATILAAYQRVFDYLSARGAPPTSIRCDNKCPREVRDFFAEREVSLQLVPP